MVELKDSQFMSAAEKKKVLHQWELFLKNGLVREKFTKSLYHHLIQNCSFIAHYDQGGFYDTYFTSGDRVHSFLPQFDKRKAKENGIPASVEYGETWWVNEEYGDINRQMIEIASRYIPNLLAKAGEEQKAYDVGVARALLQKHGLKATIRG